MWTATWPSLMKTGSVHNTVRSRKCGISHKGSEDHGYSTSGVTTPAVCARVRQKASVKKVQQAATAGPSVLSKAMRPAASVTDAEEFFLGDRELLRHLHELPYQQKVLCAMQRPHPAAHLRTVSVIDTLSALAECAEDYDNAPSKSTLCIQSHYQQKAALQHSYACRHHHSAHGMTMHMHMSDNELNGEDACSVLSLSAQPATKKMGSYSQHGPHATGTPLSSGNNKAVAAVHTRGWTKVPGWIRAIFRVARNGNLESLMASLQDMDAASIWNLSDSRGNNLWHVCAAYGHLHCFQWLCQTDIHHAIADENHSSLTPVGSAVKHGSVQIVQWLISKNIALNQVNPPEGQRTLLHLAAKHGQEGIVQWLAEYMNNNNMDLNRKDSNGNTAIHLAAKYGHVSTLKALILHGADIRVKNERGLRPHRVAIENGELGCADFLLTMEVCLSLSSELIITESSFQFIQQESAEMRNEFKELFMITKQLLRRQEDMLRYTEAVCNRNGVASDEAESDFSSLPRNYSSGNNRVNELTLGKLQYIQEKTQSNVLPEEMRLLQLEEKWHHLHTNKCVADTKSPTDLVRTHFAEALAKYTSPNLPREAPLSSSSDSSLSNYSQESATEEEEKKTPAWLSASSGQRLWDQALLSHMKVQAFLDCLTPQKAMEALPRKEVQSSCSKIVNGGSIDFNHRLKRCTKQLPKNDTAESSQENVSFKVLFENNPELRQEGQTCSVLEVLEPSNTEGEDEPSDSEKRQKNNSGDSSTCSFTSTEGYGNLAFHVTDTREKKCEKLNRPKVQVAPVKDSGDDPSVLLTNIAEPQNSRYMFGLKIQQSQDYQHSSLREQQLHPEKRSCVVANKSLQVKEKKSKGMDLLLNYSKPDLIQGTKQASLSSFRGTSTADINSSNSSIQEAPHCREVTSQDSTKKEAGEVGDHVTALQPTLENHESVSNVSASGSTKKRSGFLLKFSLKGRWTSKQKQQQQQKKCEEISPEEFRETYMWNSAADVPLLLPSSHETKAGTTLMQKHIRLLRKEIPHKEPPLPMPMIPVTRREPPPVPPHAPSVTGDVTPLLKQNNQSNDDFIYASSSLMWPESILSKITGGSMSRPASSASQTEDNCRGKTSAGFMLQKALSSDELLLNTHESYVAGRQSPAQSEVSKTESALSPPSDISKTESARDPPHLGKIEETVAAQGGEALALKKVVSTTDMEQKKDVESSNASVICMQGGDPQQERTKKTVLAVMKRKRILKPWYEVSDEEDTLLQDKYQTAGTRSNSEDETEVAVLA